MVRMDSRSCRAERLRRRAHVRFLPQGFQICTSEDAEYAKGRFRRRSFQELPFEVRHLMLAQEAPLPGPELFILQKSNANSPEFFDRMAYSLKHAPNLLIPALMECNFKP